MPLLFDLRQTKTQGMPIVKSTIPACPQKPVNKGSSSLNDYTMDTTSALNAPSDSNSLQPTAFERAILTGGDERLNLLSNGLNKYNVHPTQFEGVFNRGSCTCSPFTPEGYAAAKELFEKVTPSTFPKFHNAQTQRIKKLLNFDGEDRFDVFFAPSGSDLCYYPLLFSQMIHPGKKIVNLVTCPEELGSGSALALNARYYCTSNQTGHSFEKGSPLSESLDIQRVDFPARGHSGKIISHQQKLMEKKPLHLLCRFFLSF